MVRFQDSVPDNLEPKTSELGTANSKLETSLMGTLNFDRYHAAMGDASYKDATRLHNKKLSDAQATFYVTQRKLAFAPCLGHERLVRLLIDSQIDRPRLRFLEQDRGGLQLFSKAIEDMQFAGKIRAVRPATIVFAQQPFADITGAFGLTQVHRDGPSVLRIRRARRARALLRMVRSSIPGGRQAPGGGSMRQVAPIPLETARELIDFREKKRVTLSVKRQPYWVVMKDVLRDSNLRLQEMGERGMCLMEGQDPQTAGPSVVHGPFMIVATAVENAPPAPSVPPRTSTRWA